MALDANEVMRSSLSAPPAPSPTRVFGGKPLFSMGWRQGSTVRCIVFNNLEGKFLKRENLFGRVNGTGPDAIFADWFAHNSQLPITG
jgi:hypothetical protein